MNQSVEFLLRDGAYHLHWAALHRDEEGSGDGTYFIGIGQGFALIYIDFVDYDLVSVRSGQLFEYGSQHSARATPPGIEIHDGREVAKVVPLSMWGTIVGHVLDKLAFGEIDNVHTAFFLVSSQYDNVFEEGFV